MGRNQEDSEGRETLKCHEKTVSRNKDFEEVAGESLKGSGRKGSLVMWLQNV